MITFQRARAVARLRNQTGRHEPAYGDGHALP